MIKEALLNELSHNTYVILKPSSIDGIGVYAIKDIPKGCRDMFSKTDPEDKWITITRNEVATLPEHARFLIGNYCLYDEDHYFVPGGGFKKIDLSLFLNHSNQPNIISIDHGDFFETTRDIKKGEELLVDYGEIVDDI